MYLNQQDFKLKIKFQKFEFENLKFHCTICDQACKNINNSQIRINKPSKNFSYPTLFSLSQKIQQIQTKHKRYHLLKNQQKKSNEIF